MRLDRFLAKTLNESRNDVKKYIRSGRIKVNDLIIKTDGYNIQTVIDIVTFDDNVLTYIEFHYYVINKPAGYVCATEDNLNPTIINYAPEFSLLKLHTVGRLDKDTTGILLLTNDGKLTHRLIAPKTSTKKVYIATVDAAIPLSLVTEFENGFMINDEYKTLPARLELLDEKHARVTLVEGKYHQVKRMFSAFGLNVTALHRESFANVTALDLKLGEFRPLNRTELEEILKV